MSQRKKSDMSNMTIKALTRYLADRDFLVKKYFVLDETYFLIEVISVLTAEFFYLYVPDSFEMKKDTPSDTTYSIKYVELKISNDKVSEYIVNDDNLVDNAYHNIDNDLERVTENIENSLEKRYNKDITLTDITQKDMGELKSMNRQLGRLKNCVETLDYKICIFYKNFFGIIRRTGNCIDFFKIRDYNQVEKKQFFIVISLDSFLKKLRKNIDIVNEINIVKNSIYKVLEKNEVSHIKFIDKILDTKNDLLKIPTHIQNKQLKYDEMIFRLENLLRILNEREKTIIQDIENIKMENLLGNLSIVEHKNNLDKDLANTIDTKTNIIKYIFMIRQKKENIMLNIDQLMFDNTVMWNRIVNNCAQLKEYY